jgi:hypothetical protein
MVLEVACRLVVVLELEVHKRGAVATDEPHLTWRDAQWSYF